MVTSKVLKNFCILETTVKLVCGKMCQKRPSFLKSLKTPMFFFKWHVNKCHKKDPRFRHILKKSSFFFSGNKKKQRAYTIKNEKKHSFRAVKIANFRVKTIMGIRFKPNANIIFCAVKMANF